MKKIISIVLAFCIMMASFSCTTSKLISIEEASRDSNSNHFIILNTQKKAYALHNPIFTDDYIEGIIKKLSSPPKNVIHIYTNRYLDVNLQGDDSEYIKINKKEISKVTYQKYNRRKTIITSVAIPSILITILIIWLNNMTFSVGPLF